MSSQWIINIFLWTGAVSLTIIARDSNSMDISPCSNFITGHQIATNFTHAMTAQLLCHVQNFVVITVLEER